VPREQRRSQEKRGMERRFSAGEGKWGQTGDACYCGTDQPGPVEKERAGGARTNSGRKSIRAGAPMGFRCGGAALIRQIDSLLQVFLISTGKRRGQGLEGLVDIF